MVLDGPRIPACERVLAFGRYRGKLLGSLSSEYLRWLASEKSLREGHWTIWGELAKEVLHERDACQHPRATADADLEEDFTDHNLVDSLSWKKTLVQLDLPGVWVNSTTYASLLRCCGKAKALLDGKHAHHHMIKSGMHRDIYLGNLIVQMYGECGALEDARAVLASMHHWNVLSWNFMIRAYVQHGQAKEALGLFEEMWTEQIMPDRVTFLSIISACGHPSAVPQGQSIHNLIIQSEYASDVVLWNAIITMYGKFGSLHEAQRMFQQMPKYDVVTWNAIIGAFGHRGMSHHAIQLFGQMQQEGVIPDSITYVSILDACTSQAALPEGQRIHTYLLVTQFEKNVVVGTALVNMYGKCAQLEVARRIFDNILKRNVFSWTAMIAAYAQNAQGKDALKLFVVMEQEGVPPSKITFISILDACVSHGSLSIGQQILTRIQNSGVVLDVVMGTAIVNLYGRCGRLEDARRVFDKLSMRDVASWNAMIAVYAQHGQGRKALFLFDQMRHGEVMPDKVTYVSVLCVCSHTGLVNEGCQLFVSMTQVYGMIPIEDHYNCIIDLLGRAGRLDVAEDLVNKMPFEPSAATVMSLLGACRNQVDVKRGERVAQLIFRLDPQNPSPYIMLSNIYVAAGMEIEAAKIISTMRNKGLKEEPSCNFIKVAGTISELISNEYSHL